MTIDDLEKLFGDLDIFPMVPLHNNKEVRAVGYKDKVIRLFKTDGDMVDVCPSTERQFTNYIIEDRLSGS